VRAGCAGDGADMRGAAAVGGRAAVVGVVRFIAQRLGDNGRQQQVVVIGKGGGQAETGGIDDLRGAEIAGEHIGGSHLVGIGVGGDAEAMGEDIGQAGIAAAADDGGGTAGVIDREPALLAEAVVGNMAEAAVGGVDIASLWRCCDRRWCRHCCWFWRGR